MQDTAFRWLLNIFLAILIYANCEIGRLLGNIALPIAVSVVWPATGFSLAAILLFGFRTWPGIFLGNFLYNAYHFYPLGSEIPFAEGMQTLLFASVVSLGSLLQALVGGYIMQRFTSKGYFTTVKDVVIFLVPVGLFSSFIASTIGVSMLVFYDSMPWQQAFQTWIQFWLGDTLGVFIISPLLVVWSTYPLSPTYKNFLVEAFFMTLFFVLVSILAFAYSYPVAHWYIPLSLWAAYRFRMHGATLITFWITLAFIIPTSLGIGTFITLLREYPLIISVSFLEIIVITTLLFAAVVSERNAGLVLLQGHKINLEDAIAMHEQDLEKMAQELHIQEKLQTLNAITSKIAALLELPLKMCDNFVQISLDSIQTMKTEAPEKFAQSLHMLRTYVEQIEKFLTRTKHIAERIKEQTAYTVLTQKGKTHVDINTLVESSLEYTVRKNEKTSPNFRFTTVKRLDQKIKTKLLQPEEFAHALVNILLFCIASLKEKAAKKSSDFEPILEMQTKEDEMHVIIIIRDNGLGISQPLFSQFFLSFEHMDLLDQCSDVFEESLLLGLSLAHDIIASVYQGHVNITSSEGDFFQLELVLPKNRVFA